MIRRKKLAEQENPLIFNTINIHSHGDPGVGIPDVDWDIDLKIDYNAEDLQFYEGGPSPKQVMREFEKELAEVWEKYLGEDTGTVVTLYYRQQIAGVFSTEENMLKYKKLHETVSIDSVFFEGYIVYFSSDSRQEIENDQIQTE